MQAEWVLSKLEERWGEFRNRIGDDWDNFVESFEDAVQPLRSDRNRGDLESAVDRVCEVLTRYEFGRELLRSYQSSDHIRLLRPSYETMDEEARIDQVCNRLLNLPNKQSAQKGSESQSDKERSE